MDLRSGSAKFMGHLAREAAPFMTHLLSDYMEVIDLAKSRHAVVD